MKKDFEQFIELIDEPINIYIEELTDQIPNEAFISSNKSFTNPQQEKEKIKLQFKELAKSFFNQANRIENAFDAFERESPHVLSKEEIEQFSDFSLDCFLKNLDGKNLSKALYNENDQTLQERIQMPYVMVTNLYKVGSYLYSHHQYKDASDIFFVLCALDSSTKENWLGLGLCEKFLGHLTQALYYFAVAALLDQEDPQACMLAAECYIQQKDWEKAKIELEDAEKAIPFTHDQESWKKLGKILRSKIKK